MMAHSEGEMMSNANAGRCLLVALFVVLISGPLHAADDQVHVVPASELDQWWQLAPGYGPPQSPAPDPSQPIPTGCMVIAFEIHSDGSVSNERVWRTTLTNSLQDERVKRGVLRAMHQSRFVPVPANQNESPVYTYKVFTYDWIRQGSDDREAERVSRETASKCDIPDFPQQVQAMVQAAAKGNGGTQ